MCGQTLGNPYSESPRLRLSSYVIYSLSLSRLTHDDVVVAIAITVASNELHTVLLRNLKSSKLFSALLLYVILKEKRK